MAHKKPWSTRPEIPVSKRWDLMQAIRKILGNPTDAQKIKNKKRGR